MADNKDEQSGTDDELEQDDWTHPGDQKIDDVAAKKAKSDKEKKAKEEKTKRRKKDTAKIVAGGDFQVQVHIIEGRDLKGKDSSGLSDPVTTITIFDKKQSTKIKQKTKNPKWDQVLYFELPGLNSDELSQGKCNIQVFDADILSRNDLIGTFEFDLAWIYYKKYHEVYNQWIALTNTAEEEENDDEPDENKDEEGIDGVEGYLKVSITILGPNDEQHIHDDEEDLEADAALESGMILISPGIEQTPHLLTIKVYKMRNLTNTDDDGMFSIFKKKNKKKNLDPFLYVEFAGVRLRSKTYQGTTTDVQAEFLLPVMEPVFTKNITLTIMDYDKLSRNDRIGCIKFDYTELKKVYDGDIKPNWYPIYGAPQGYQSGYARKMNKGLVEGSNFRGEILLEMKVEHTEKKRKRKVNENINGLMKDNPRYPQMEEYYARIDLYEGTEINKIGGLDHDMFVMIYVNNKHVHSTKKKVADKNSSITWYESLNNKGKDKALGTFELPKGWHTSKTPIPLPDVIIYLCVKESFGNDIEQVSYIRIPLNQIIPKGKKRCWENPPQWFDLKENLALDKYKDNVFPGSLLIAINAGPKIDICGDLNNGVVTPVPAICRPFANSQLFKRHPTDPTPVNLDIFDGGNDNDDDKKQQQLQTKPKMQRQITPHTASQTIADVTIKLIQAVNLAALDRNGKSDPYVKVTIQGRKKNDKQTKECDHIKKTLCPKWNQDLEFQKVEVGDKLSLRVMDWDFGMDKDDEIGRVAEIILKGVDKEEWYTLTPSNEVAKKYRKKKHLIANMKVKIGIKYEWEDLDLDDDARAAKKKKRLSFGSLGKVFKKKDDNDPTSRAFKDKITKLTKPIRERMQLRAHIYQARNLENTDMSGLSDAYLVVRYCGTSKKTRVIDDHIDPRWYQSLCLDVEVPIPLKYAPKIYCEIYDHDDFSKDQSLGRFTVDTELAWKIFVDKNKDNVHDKMEGKPQPIWYSLQDVHHDLVPGQVLCAFELVSIKQSDFKIPNIKPPTKKQWIHVVTLGLRDIQSVFGVHKSFVEFESNGTIYGTFPSRVPDSRNPNFCQVLHVEVDLPIERLFLPNLNLTIKDTLFGGLIKRKIGYASIEIEDIMYDAELFKFTEMEIEEKTVRDDAKAEYDKHIDDDEEKKELFEDNKITDDVIDGNVVKIGFADDTDNSDDSRTPLMSSILGVGSKKSSRKSSGVTISKLQTIYEYTKKNKYNLKKLLAPYMQNRAEYGDELEDKVDLKPFLQIPFFAGKNKRNVGFFKGFISFSNTKTDLGKNCDNILKEITQPIDLYLRIYVLQAIRLVPQDTNGKADPYLIIKIGDQKISTRNDHFSNTLDPYFYCGKELAVKLPGASKLTLEVWDWDGIGDDMIGSTTIDIEDRWYSKIWREIDLKPTEERTLWNGQSSVSQGKLKLWMDLLTIADSKRYPMIDITPPDPDPYELRVIVWECKDCPIMDETTNMNDLYITGGLVGGDLTKDQKELQQTDLHFRSQNGKGSFNWRMKFPIHLPKRKYSDYPNFQVQIWDRDFFSPSDNISEAVIPLQPFLRYCEKYSKSKRCVLTKDDEDEFWIDLAAKGGGKVKLSFELLPHEMTLSLPAGFGRKEPNNNPWLPEPVGRAKFSLLNPCDSLRNLLGDRLCAKICCFFCCLVCIAFIIFITPNLVSAIMANLVTGM